MYIHIFIAIYLGSAVVVVYIILLFQKCHWSWKVQDTRYPDVEQRYLYNEAKVKDLALVVCLGVSWQGSASGLFPENCSKKALQCKSTTQHVRNESRERVTVAYFQLVSASINSPITRDSIRYSAVMWHERSELSLSASLSLSLLSTFSAFLYFSVYAFSSTVYRSIGWWCEWLYRIAIETNRRQARYARTQHAGLFTQ